MVVAYVTVTLLAATANLTMAALDLRRDEQVLANMAKVALDERWLVHLGLLKAAGGLGLLVGFVVPILGVAAASGLVLFFLGALATHLLAREYSLPYPMAFLVLAVGSLVLRLVTL